MRFLLFFYLISVPALAKWDPKLSVVAGPCTCFWDQETKDYGQKSTGILNTTVQYFCGYVCRADDGKFIKVRGGHVASFAREYGDEVVCDGLNYQYHETPMSKNYYAYIWDGQTHAFDPRFSQSSELQKWGREACGEKHLNNRGAGRLGISAKYITDAKILAGYKVQAQVEQPWRGLVLQDTFPEFTGECSGIGMSALRAKNRQEAAKLKGCGEDKEFESRMAAAMAVIYKSKSEVEFVSALEAAARVLYCPHYKPSSGSVFAQWIGVMRKAKALSTECVNHRLVQYSCAAQARSAQISRELSRQLLPLTRNAEACRRLRQVDQDRNKVETEDFDQDVGSAE